MQEASFSDNNTEQNLTVDEVAARKGVSVPAIYKAVREQRLPSERIYGRIVVPASALAGYEPERGGARGGGRPRKAA